MSKEIKIGILTFVAILGTIWGYKFVKGENLFSRSMILTTTFEDVTQLSVSSPVYIRGMKIGTVTDIDINEENLTEMIVSFKVEGDYKIPKDAVVAMRSEGLVGGNGLAVNYDKICNDNCVKSGDHLESQTLGLLGSLVGEGEVEEVTNHLSNTVKAIISDLGREDSDAKLDIIIRELANTTQNLAALSTSTNQLIQKNDRNISKTLSNMESITKNLSDNNSKITSVLANLDKTLAQFSNTDIKKLVDNSSQTMADASKSLQSFDNTLAEANAGFRELSELLNSISDGEGSLSKMLSDKELYDNLNATSREMSLLLQDLRLNPDRYIKVSVFGRKKAEPYDYPDGDPAKNN